MRPSTYYLILSKYNWEKYSDDFSLTRPAETLRPPQNDFDREGTSLLGFLSMSR